MHSRIHLLKLKGKKVKRMKEELANQQNSNAEEMDASNLRLINQELSPCNSITFVCYVASLLAMATFHTENMIHD